VLRTSVALFCSAVLVVALRSFAIQMGLVDRPLRRQSPAGNIPLIGGIAMTLGAGIVSLLTVNPSPGSVAFAASAGLLLVTGVLDDRWGMSATRKFAVQILAASIAVGWGGHVIETVGNLAGTGDLYLGSAALWFTVFCFVGVINAVNMIDGMDGLAGGVTLVALGWFAAASFSTGTSGGAPLVLVWIGAVGGFLLFNFPAPWRSRASVFMGDAGSMVLGLVLTWFALELSQGPRAPLAPMAAVWILGVPIMDAVSLMLRRALVGRSPFSGDCEHLHDKLRATGLSDNQTLATILLISALFGAVGFLGSRHAIPGPILCFGYVGLFAGYCLVMHFWAPMPGVTQGLRAPRQQDEREVV
jgi:UDP-GlcNAc:undecaprenyl-phosphate/decaprenyl-phosphate GlcNAc-1-phosphate transferase